jgi:hypothetical protein
MHHALDLMGAKKDVSKGPKTVCQVAHIFPVSKFGIPKISGFGYWLSVVDQNFAGGKCTDSSILTF